MIKDIERLQQSKQISMEDFIKIIKAVSCAPSFRHLILYDQWKVFLIDNAERMEMSHIRDIEAAMENIDYRNPYLIQALNERKQDIL